MQDAETGWLIERYYAGTTWWTGYGWTTDSLDAVRFARECDAARVIKSLVLGAFAREHTWCAPA